VLKMDNINDLTIKELIEEITYYDSTLNNEDL